MSFLKLSSVNAAMLCDCKYNRSMQEMKVLLINQIRHFIEISEYQNVDPR